MTAKKISKPSEVSIKVEHMFWYYYVFLDLKCIFMGLWSSGKMVAVHSFIRSLEVPGLNPNKMPNEIISW